MEEEIVRIVNEMAEVLKDSGIAGICVVSAIMKVADPETATRELKQAFLAL